MYSTTYFLVVNNAVLFYDKDHEKVTQRLADLYGDALCIDYYGFIGRESILKHEYMDSHEGADFFISNVWIERDGEKKDMQINIIDIQYVLEYFDVDYGLALIEWLKANPEKYQIDYSKGDLKKYCLMAEDSFYGSFDSLEEAYEYLKKDELYGNLHVALPEKDDTILKDTGLDCLDSINGYHSFQYNVYANEENGGMEFDIAIIEIDSVFRNYHKSNAQALGHYLNRDKSQYSIEVIG